MTEDDKDRPSGKSNQAEIVRYSFDSALLRSVDKRGKQFASRGPVAIIRPMPADLLRSLPKAKAAFIQPMDCLPVSKLPEGPPWLWEILCGGPHKISVAFRVMWR